MPAPTRFSERTVDPDPLVQFQRWYDEALAAAVPDAHAMVLATARRGGTPSARMVLLRGVDARGFVFFTNFASRKAHELETTGSAALLFYWQPLHRQVRIEGAVERVADGEADTYFASRPRGSQIGAWASPQSTSLPSRADLEERVAETERRFRGTEVPRPPHWGGYRVLPTTIEFWQERPDRLHDRLVYRHGVEGWTIERLAP